MGMDLNKCPFCGGAPTRSGDYCVVCSCGASVNYYDYSGRGDDRDYICQLWNKRSAPSARAVLDYLNTPSNNIITQIKVSLGLVVDKMNNEKDEYGKRNWASAYQDICSCYEKVARCLHNELERNEGAGE